MHRKWEEKSKRNLLEIISKAAKIDYTKLDTPELFEGATEKDLVYGGLEEVMSAATEEVITTSLNDKIDLRTAAYVNGINKIDDFYAVAGIQ